MNSRDFLGAALVSATALSAGAASAEEQTLRFRLVTHNVNELMLEVADVPGQAIGSVDAVGVATFEDGRIAYKSFVYSNDGTETAGSFIGYSTYTFENGDAIVARFTGGWSGEGTKGDYEVLSGKGGYSGVTGTGHFESVEAAWEGATLFDGSFTIDVPGS